MRADRRCGGIPGRNVFSGVPSTFMVVEHVAADRHD
jgi:hypothetical protein